MKIVKAGYQLINEPSITKKIERIARICYKSEEKIGEGTDIKMIRDLITRQHTAMLEHGDVCLEVTQGIYDLIEDAIDCMENNLAEINGMCGVPKKYYLRRTSTSLEDGSIRYIVSGNMRAWYEFFIGAGAIGALPMSLYALVNEEFECLFNGMIPQENIGDVDDVWEFNPDNQYCTLVLDFNTLTPAERMVHETFSVLFTVDRGVTHELVRHRPVSFAQESTRYCDYSLGKHGNEITVIEPCFFTGEGNEDKYNAWVSAMEDAENHYLDLKNLKAPAQQIRDVLPTSVKAEIVMTTNLIEWKHIFSLRACDSTGPAHPQMKEVMIPVFLEMQEKYPFAYGDMVAASVK